MTQVRQREIRVFLSSTFRDMEFERNHLMKRVFPKVRAACLARRVGFTEIDLRWGITEEESRNGATVEICLAEIDRCRDFPPFFIGFLGERYGWVPKEQELAAYWKRHATSSYAKHISRAVKRGISVTELEMELAVLGDGAADKIAGHALFFLRDRTLTDHLYFQDTGKAPNPQDTGYYDHGAGKLDALKERIRQTLFIGIDGYETVEQFGQAVEDYLLAQFDRYFPASDIPSPLQRMQDAHAAFRFHRLQNFLPRPDVRKQVLKAMHLRAETRALGPILLAGPSGQGKSALMADLARYLGNEQSKIRWRVIDHYVGADEYNHLDSWIKRILETLHSEIGDIAGPVPGSAKERMESLSTWIAMAARRAEQRSNEPEKPVRFVLILDAIDQLIDGGKDLGALKPEILGPGAILIVSAADGTPARELAKEFEAIEVPLLPDSFKAKLIQDTLKRYRKKLPDDLAQKLATAPQSGSPLYLTLALEELRLDASHESLGNVLDAILQSLDASSLFLHRFLLDEDYGRQEIPALAAVFMALLGASRNGLTENELADLLALPNDPKAADTQRPRLPQVFLSRLLTAFQPFLLNKQGNRAPMHRIFGAAALDNYGALPVREHLYRHFRKGYGKGKQEFDQRSAAEALHQITRMANVERDNWKNARRRLVKDLTALHVPVNLYAAEEDVIFAALSSLDHKERVALARQWARQIPELVERNVAGVAERIGGFSEWLGAGKLGDYVCARTLQEQLRGAFLRIFGDDDPRSVRIKGDLANTLETLGDTSGSLALNDEILASLSHDEHAGNPALYLSMNRKAVTLCYLGDHSSARSLQEDALAGIRRIFSDDHPSVLEIKGDLAMTLGEQRDLTAERDLEEAVLDTLQRIHGDDHPDVLTAMGNLAETMKAMGNLERAKSLQEIALSGFSRMFAENHPKLLTAMVNLSDTLYQQGDMTQARSYCEVAVDGFRATLGEENWYTIWAIEQLAPVLSEMGHLQQARELEEKVVAANGRIYGIDNPVSFRSMANLAVTCHLMGDFERARQLQEFALAGYRCAGGQHREDVFWVMTHLGGTLHALGDLEEAKSHLEAAVAGFRSLFDDDHPDTVRAMSKLAAMKAALDGKHALD